MHWLQYDEDGGQGENLNNFEEVLSEALRSFWDQLYVNLLLSSQVMFAQLLRCHKLEALEELPRKPVLDKEGFLMPVGLDKITLVNRT